MQELTPYEDPAFSAWRVWREIVPRPESPEAAVDFLREIAEREIERLQDLLVDLEEIEGDDALELAEQASFSRQRRLRAAATVPDRPDPRAAADDRPAGEAPQGRGPEAGEKSAEGTQSAGPPEAGRSPVVVPVRPDRDPRRRGDDRLPGEAAGGGGTAVANPKKRANEAIFEPAVASIESPARGGSQGNASGGSISPSPAA